MSSLNKIKYNFEELTTAWDLNIKNYNSKNLQQISIYLNKSLMKQQLSLLKKKYKNL